MTGQTLYRTAGDRLEELRLRLLPHVAGDYSWANVGGFRMFGSTSHQRYLGRLRTGRVEPFTVELFCTAIRPGMVVADLGAYLGYFTLLAARAVGPTGAVHAFECNPANYRFLLHNVRLNGHVGRVVTTPAAVADEVGRLRFNARGGDLSTGRLLASADPRQGFDVPSTTVDHHLGGRRLDVMKMDVEGAEVRVLEGMLETLAVSPDLVVLAECNPSALRAAGASAGELIDGLLAAGFDVAAIDEKHRKLRPVDDDLRDRQHEEDHKFYVNLYCARRVAIRR